MRCYKILLFLNLFANINTFMIRSSTSNHNLYKLSRTSSKIFTQTPVITNDLKKVSSQQSLLNIPKSSIITNKCKKDNNEEELKSILIIVCHNAIKFGIIYYILFKYFYHII